MRARNMRGYTVLETTTDRQRLRRAEAFVSSGLRTGAARRDLPELAASRA